MRQLRVVCFGAPRDVLTIVDADDPPLVPGEVRLACQAIGLNFVDVMLCRGEYPTQLSPPFTPVSRSWARWSSHAVYRKLFAMLGSQVHPVIDRVIRLAEVPPLSPSWKAAAPSARSSCSWKELRHDRRNDARE